MTSKNTRYARTNSFINPQNTNTIWMFVIATLAIQISLSMLPLHLPNFTWWLCAKAMYLSTNWRKCKIVWIYLWWSALCLGHQRRNTWVSSVVWDDCIRYMRYQGKEHLRQKCRLGWGRKGDEWQITSGDRLADLSAAGQHCMKDNRQWTHSW